MNTTVFGSDGTSLRFYDDAEKAAYDRAISDVEMHFYGRERAKYGIWCGNQGKYVSHRSEMNDWDGFAMEDRYAEYVRRVGHP